MPRKVLLIGWDAADWQIINPLLEQGQLPNLERFINHGVMGNLATLQPMLSPMLWNSVATGVLADKHGITGFTTVNSLTGKLRPFGSIDRKVKALWNILSQNGLRTHVVNWFGSHPAEPVNGVYVSEIYTAQIVASKTDGPLPALPDNSVHPSRLKNTLAELRVAPEEIDSGTIGLFVPRFLEVDQTKDNHLEKLALLLAECFTAHSAATWIMENEAWDFMAVYYPTIDHICHNFMKFHPPRPDHISAKDFDFYKEVVNSTYRLHDLLLGRLLELAGEEATVIICSDHGYQSGARRQKFPLQTPGGTILDHRATGILAMNGPALKKDVLIHGASLLDLAPTILELFGLPIGQDMAGRVLADAFLAPPRISTIPSWEQVDGPSGMHDPRTRVLWEDQEILLQQFAALGYIAPSQGNGTEYAAIADAENKWNLARVYVSSGRFVAALPLLEEVYEHYPLRFDFGLVLAECQFRVGLMDEATQVLQTLADVFPHRALASLYLGILEYEQGRIEAALAHFQRVEQANMRSPDFFNYLGLAYLRANRIEEAQSAFERALAMDAQNALAHVGQARCRLRRGDHREAAESALQAIGLNFSLAQAHYFLGIALARLGERNSARQAFETCFRFNPRHVGALRCLIRLGAGVPELKEQTERYRALYQKVSPLRFSQEEQVRKLRDASRFRARQREENRRMWEMTFSCQPSGPPRLQSEITFMVVSGLPRSGTSLMMQMLQAGGIPPMTDGRRGPDPSNPEGYFEWEEIKQVGNHPGILAQARGKAIKVISMLLPRLPSSHRYKVIFMNRPAAEVAASQWKMLGQTGGVAMSAEDAIAHENCDGYPTVLPLLRGEGRGEVSVLTDIFPADGLAEAVLLLEKHRDETLRLLKTAPHLEVCVVDYPSVIAAPEKEIERLVEFLGEGLIQNPEAMKKVIRSELYRNRAASLNHADEI